MLAQRPRRILKRLGDIALSLALLVAALPLILVVAASIVLEDGWPILYSQPRAGQHGRRFAVLKFRTMRVNDVPAEVMGQVGDGHPLVTRTGRLLRRFKIDELLQLINVLRGEMSLVGPRPTYPEQVARYGPFERRRLEVPPGMTGWAQVNGNVRLTWGERIALDIWYVDHWSPWLDVRILLRTGGVVLFGERPNTSALSQALAHADSADRSH